MSNELGFLTDDDAGAIDRYVAELAREEEEDLDRSAGQSILDAVDDHQRRRQDNVADPLLGAIEAAHRAKVERDKQ